MRSPKFWQSTAFLINSCCYIWRCQTSFYLFSNITAEHLATEEKQESHHEKLWQLSLWWVVWLSLGSSNHSPHHWCGLWAGDNAALTRTVSFFQEKETLGSTAASKACHLPHPQRKDSQVFLYFLLLLQKKGSKSLCPQVRLTLISTTPRPRCCLGEQRSSSPIWPAGAAKHSRHSSTLTSKAISAAVLDDQSFSLK